MTLFLNLLVAPRRSGTLLRRRAAAALAFGVGDTWQQLKVETLLLLLNLTAVACDGPTARFARPLAVSPPRGSGDEAQAPVASSSGRRPAAPASRASFRPRGSSRSSTRRPPRPRARVADELSPPLHPAPRSPSRSPSRVLHGLVVALPASPRTSRRLAVTPQLLVLRTCSSSRSCATSLVARRSLALAAIHVHHCLAARAAFPPAARARVPGARRVRVLRALGRGVRFPALLVSAGGLAAIRDSMRGPRRARPSAPRARVGGPRARGARARTSGCGRARPRARGVRDVGRVLPRRAARDRGRRRRRAARRRGRPLRARLLHAHARLVRGVALGVGARVGGRSPATRPCGRSSSPTLGAALRVPCAARRRAAAPSPRGDSRASARRSRCGSSPSCRCSSGSRCASALPRFCGARVRVAQGAVVILPMLSDRAGFAPGGGDPAAADRSSAADALFSRPPRARGFFFGGALGASRRVGRALHGRARGLSACACPASSTSPSHRLPLELRRPRRGSSRSSSSVPLPVRTPRQGPLRGGALLPPSYFFAGRGGGHQLRPSRWRPAGIGGGAGSQTRCKLIVQT